MPPKRKRTDAEAEPKVPAGRTTRSTARSGDPAGGSSSTARPATTKPKAKEASKSTVKEATQKKKATKITKAAKKAEESPDSAPESEEKLEPPLKKSKKATAATNKKAGKAEVSTEKHSKQPVASKKNVAAPVKHSPYTKVRMERLFATYADEEDPSFVGAEGLEKLCADANISMEGAQPLLFAWLLDASELGKLTKGEWAKGLDALQIDTLDKLRVALMEHEMLLISDPPTSKPLTSNKKSSMELYNKNLNYWKYATDIPGAFLKFYNFVFPLAKAPQERNIDIEIAKAFWTTLLSPKYPIMHDFIEFINEKGNVRGVNKDLWSMTLDFCQTVKPSLEDYESDGAWPTCLDEFVAWKKAGQLPPDAEAVDDQVEK